MKKIMMLVSITLGSTMLVVGLAVAVAVAVLSLCDMPFDPEMWEAWLLVMGVFAVLCGIFRAILEWVYVIKYMDEE